jgi:hypothetical protein
MFNYLSDSKRKEVVRISVACDSFWFYGVVLLFFSYGKGRFVVLLIPVLL